MTGATAALDVSKTPDAGSRRARGMTLRAAAVGLAGGMRSMAPAAMLAVTHDAAAPVAPWTRWPILRSRWGRRMFVAMATGELVADKVPAMPSRLHPPALAGRVAMAGIVGAAVGSEHGGRGRAVWGGVVGAATALVANAFFERARMSVGAETGAPDAAVAAVEDLACIGALAAVARTRP